VRARHPVNPGNKGGKSLKVVRLMGVTRQMPGLGHRPPHKTSTEKWHTLSKITVVAIHPRYLLMRPSHSFREAGPPGGTNRVKISVTPVENLADLIGPV
jgi:hypothetical protein